MSDCSYVSSNSLWTTFDTLLCVLTIANFRNTMETFECDKLLRRHMNSCSYVRTELGSSWLGGWFRGTQAREHAAWRVPDLNEFAIDVGQWLTTCIANVCRKKTLSIVRKLCKFCMRTIFAIFNLCNDWRICSIEYSVRFAHTAHVCRWRSKPNRALVKGKAACLFDTELTNVCGDVRQERMNVCLTSAITYERLLICRDE